MLNNWQHRVFYHCKSLLLSHPLFNYSLFIIHPFYDGYAKYRLFSIIIDIISITIECHMHKLIKFVSLICATREISVTRD